MAVIVEYVTDSLPATALTQLDRPTFENIPTGCRRMCSYLQRVAKAVFRSSPNGVPYGPKLEACEAKENAYVFTPALYARPRSLVTRYRFGSHDFWLGEKMYNSPLPF